MRIVQRILNLSPSETLAIKAKADDLRSHGKSVISLCAGEPDFDTPQSIKEAAKKALDEGFTKYTATGGIAPLKKAVCDHIKKHKKLDYLPHEVIITAGAKQALYNFFQCVLEPEDEVLVPSPYWVSYPAFVHLSGARFKPIPTLEKNHFKLTEQDLEKSVSSKSKILVLCSPSNPTGSVYSQKELEALLPIIQKNNLFLVCDDIYEDLVYDEPTAPHLLKSHPELKDQILHVSGVSKSFSMTGWRLGWAAGPKNVIASMESLQSHSTSNPNSIAQKAGLFALTHSIPELELMKKEFEKRRDFLCERLSAIQGISYIKPAGAFYIFVNISKCETNSNDFSHFLLDKYGVAVVPGYAFGMDGFIRMSFTLSTSQLSEAVDRLQKCLKDNYL
ncbi:MAG: pyridoxal phosphate-dependent aminotransferase [Deltaproteobacteria bacterium]|nr:pyridoxal phosphate-dependent aminotransferase [Deltaproteobacteria bacterium]